MPGSDQTWAGGWMDWRRVQRIVSAEADVGEPTAVVCVASAALACFYLLLVPLQLVMLPGRGGWSHRIGRARLAGRCRGPSSRRRRPHPLWLPVGAGGRACDGAARGPDSA